MKTYALLGGSDDNRREEMFADFDAKKRAERSIKVEKGETVIIDKRSYWIVELSDRVLVSRTLRTIVAGHPSAPMQIVVLKQNTRWSINLQSGRHCCFKPTRAEAIACAVELVRNYLKGDKVRKELA